MTQRASCPKSSFPTRLATTPSSPRTLLMYAKFAGAPPRTFPDGRRSHKTSPRPIITAGFIITYPDAARTTTICVLLKKPRRKISEVLAPDCPHVGSGTFDPHVIDTGFLQ